MLVDRKRIRGKIYSLVSHGSLLSDIKRDILLSNGLPHLVSILENYVEYKYFKYCQQHLENEIHSRLQKWSADILRDVASKTFSSRKLNDLPDSITNSTYFQLIILETRLLSVDDKSRILQNIQVAVAHAVRNSATSATASIDKVATLLELTKEGLLLVKNAFLCSNGAPAHAERENTELWEAYKKKNSDLAGEFQKEAELKEKQLDDLLADLASEPLLHQDCKEKGMELVSQLLEPLSISKVRQHGKRTLVCRKPIMLLSECIKEIEKNLRGNSIVEEVHIVAVEVIYVNCDLKKSRWHGKNLVVISKKIEVIVPNTVWDLSGEDGLNASHNPAPHGTKSGSDGSDGQNGEPGESGGYGVLIADKFVRLNLLTFRTNGGDGGSGQDGGDGKNGRNGEPGDEMSLSKLKSDFDSPAKTAGADACRTRQRTIPNVMRAITTFEKRWTDDIDLSTGNLNSDAPLPAGTYGCYIRGTTDSGLHIEFADYYKNYFAYITRHSYILVKGATGEPGQLGGFGGSGGCGGEGGYGGTLTANYLNGTSYKWECSPGYGAKKGTNGDAGDDGDNGARGDCGANGRDVGYVDCMYWKGANYYGPGTFEFRDYSSEQTSSAWCPYYDTWRKLHTTSRDPPQPIEQRRRRQKKTKVNVAATRKTDINTSQILELYADQVRNSSWSTQLGTPEFEQILKDVMSSSRNLIKNERNHRKVATKVKMNKPPPSFAKFPRKKRPRAAGSFKNGSQATKEFARLSVLRTQALQEIREAITPEWENWSKTKVDYVKHPTSTKSYNSALHALFGQVNNLGYYEAPTGIRKEVCDQLKKEAPFAGRTNILGYLRESILAYFEDESKPPSEKRSSNKSADKSKSAQKNPTETLNKYAQEFYAEPEEFDWEELLTDSKAIEEYIDFLAQPSIPFLTSDLKLVAAVEGKSVEMYLSHDSSSACIPLDIPIDAARGRPSVDLRIAVSEDHEFSIMVPVRRRDMSQVYTRIENIVGEVYSLNKKAELEAYIKNGKYGVKGPLKKESSESKVSDALSVVRQVSESFEDKDERLVVETALLSWPPLLLQVFCDRIKMTQSKADTFQRTRLAFTKITEFNLRDGSNIETLLAPFLWTIATYPESEWIREICITCLEDYFEEVRSSDVKTWRTLLSDLPEKLISCIVQLIDTASEFQINEKGAVLEFLRLIRTFELNDKMDFGKLEGVGRAQWPYQLKKLFIASKLEMLPNVAWDEENNKISQALYYLHSLYNEKSKEVRLLLDDLDTVLGRNRHSEKGKCAIITQILSNFYGGLWTLDFEVIKLLRESSTVERWFKDLGAKMSSGSGPTRSLSQIRKIVESDSNTTLSPEDIARVVEIINWMSANLQTTKFNLSDLKSEIRGKALSTDESIWIQAKVVQAVDSIINQKLGYCLRPTQKFAIISALLLGSRGKNLLSQIATGEGKTCVVLTVAIVRSLFGQKIDVVTSSGVLAQRDAIAYQSVFSAFGLTVGEVTSDSQEERSKAYQCDVVYGEATHFERDYLLDRFYNQNIRGARGFSNVIVDEVDSMFLDKGNSVLYLSHQPPDLDSLEALFVFIWLNVVRTVNSGEFHPVMIHELVMSSIHPTITAEDLLSVVDGGEVKGLWDWMLTKKLINGSGRIIARWRDCPSILKTLPEAYEDVKRQLEYLIKKQMETPGRIKVMKYLKPFVEHHLYSWVKSAFQATQLTEGKEYVVDVDRSKTDLDKNPKIMILDLDTGVDLKESQWNEALHQFLQLKHGCKLSLMSLKAVFISNISFFNKYTRVFGLTGTIGTDSDRNFLKSTYEVEFLSMPLALPKQFIEQEPIISRDASGWKRNIFEDTQDKLECGRSVLIICGTVQEAEVLQAHFTSQKVTYSIELYRRDYETFKVTEEGQTLQKNHVIIATNLAGRGTDIKLSRKLKENGGLHVILSYLPENLRVEQQAFGRAARCGDPGTGRLIFLDTLSTSSSSSTGKALAGDAINLKIQRDDLEIGRVTDISSYYNNVIRKEEEIFETFQESYEQLTSALDKAYKYIQDHSASKSNCEESRKMLEGNIREVKELVMYSLLDDWAFWLDRYSTVLLSKQDPSRETMFDKGLHKFETDERALTQEFLRMTGKYEEISNRYEDPGWLRDTWAWTKSMVGIRNTAGIEDYALTLIHEPALLIKVAKCFATRKEHRRAEAFLKKVVEEEEDHSTVALYYQVYCKLKQKDWKTDEFRRLVQNLTLKLDESRIRQSSYASTITEIECVDSQKILHGNGYRKQKENVMKLIGLYRTSIDNITGNDRILPQDFSPVCGENAREYLCDYLLEQGALLQAKFNFKFDPEKIQQLAESFCMSRNETREILEGFDGRLLVPAVEKQLKTQLNFPSRGDFWKQIANCLDSVQTFAVVQGMGDDSSSQDDTSKKTGKKRENKKNEFTPWIQSKRPFLSKYGSDMSDNCGHKEILKGDKADFQQEQKFISLRKAGQLCYEQVGYVNISKLRNVELKKYHKIGKGVFKMIEGIGEEDSAKIFDMLVKSSIVDEEGILQSTDWTKEKLELTLDFEVYRSDIQSILHSKCRYKYEVLSIVYQYESYLKKDSPTERTKQQVTSSSETKQSVVASFELKVSLPSRPCKDFVMTAMDLGFISGLRPNPSYFNEGGVTNFFKNVFKEPTSWAKWVGKKTGICGKSSKPYLWLSHLRNLFPAESNGELEELYLELKRKRWIQSDGEIILEVGEAGLQQLPPKFEYHQPEIVAVAEWERERAKDGFLKDALSIVYEAQGKLKTLESPDASLVDLEVKFEGNPDKGDFLEEMATFTLSGFDHVIDTIEEKYTSKMIFSALAVVMLGLVQIAVGIYLEFVSLGSGTFLAGGLIQEGIGDVIYGLMAFKSGHFSWQDWVDNKWRSIAITAATMGIGALLSKGVKFSKFGQRLFGSWGSEMSGRAVQEAMKEAGKAGIKRSVFTVLLKSFGYKVLHGCAAAAGSMAVSYAYDKALKRFIDHFSANFFAKTHATVNGHSISTTLSELIDKVGVENAQEILNRCTTRALKTSSCEADAQHYFGQIVAPVLNGLKEATGKMSRAGTFSNQESTMLMMLLQLASYMMTTTAVLSALSKMEQSITKHLNEVEKEVRGEMSTQVQGGNNQQVKKASRKEKDEFMYQFKEKTNELMKEKIGGVMQHVIIEPLMNVGCQKLLTSIGRGIRGKIVDYRESKLKAKIDKVKFELNSNPDAPEERKRDLHKQVVQLCSKSRDPNVVAHAVEFGGPLGVESVQALADKLGVTIIVESDNPNIPKEFKPRGRGDTGKTLHLKHSVTSDDPNDLGHWESASGAIGSGGADNGQSPSTNFSPDCLLDAVNKELKDKCPSTNPVNRSELADFMRKDEHFREFVKNGWHHTYNSIGGFGGAKFDDLEKKGECKQEIIEDLKKHQKYLQESNQMQDASTFNNADSNKENSPRHDEGDHARKRRKGGGRTSARRKAKDQLGPIKEFSTENINGVEVVTFQSGEVTFDTIKNKQSRSRSEAIKKTKDAGCPQHDQAGHGSAYSWGAPTCLINLFPQSAKENMGVNRDIEGTVTKFIRENKEGNPSVSYMRKFDGVGGASTRPTSHTFYFEFKLNGKTIENGTKVYIVPNPPCPPERKCNSGPPAAAG